MFYAPDMRTYRAPMGWIAKERRPRGRTLAVVLLCLALAVSGCSSTKPSMLAGRAVSMQFDPNRVAGLLATDGASGPLVEASSAIGRVRNTDNGDTDRLALLAIDDIEEFWQNNYRTPLSGSFAPVAGLISVNPEQSGPVVCGESPSEFAFNAAYCRRQDVIVWDRVELLPIARKFFGDMAVNGLLAHEYGHAVQHLAGLTEEWTPVLVSEQQADCFAGMYLRWVAEGGSSRYSMNTTTGLDRVLAGAIAVRDRPPDFNPFGLIPVKASHGTALDRISAFQQGFDLGVDSCAKIDSAEIAERRGDIPPRLFDPASPDSDMAIDTATLSTLMDVLNSIFAPVRPPQLRIGLSCGSGPAVFCSPTNTVEVDMKGLQQIGTPADEGDKVLLQGDNSAISVVISRYMLALQQQRSVGVNGDTAALRTACLTGAAQRQLAEPEMSNGQLVLGAGDLDEAISGLLTNGIVASDADGSTVRSGFTRIMAFRSGLDGTVEGCYRRFP